jgi:serine/threonine-protein kinase HipA
MQPVEFDSKVLRALFGRPVLPAIEMTSDEISVEARKLAGKVSISGVQPKLSVGLEGTKLVPVAGGGQFILKPQTQDFPDLPQNEHLCMTMGARYGLRVAPCLLMALADGTPAFLVKRFDRFRQGRRLEKLACEDMHQILGGPDKYAGSHEQIAGAIRQYCTFGPLDCQRLYELTVFNFAIGNGDAHRKNFSLLTGKDGTVALSPAYDLVSSRLAIPGEREELALALGGKKNNIRRNDLLRFAEHMNIDAAFAERRLGELLELSDAFAEMIARSQLSPDLRERFTEIVGERLKRLSSTGTDPGPSTPREPRAARGATRAHTWKV